MRRSIIRLSILSLCALLLSCSDSTGNSSLVTFNSVTKNPIVVNADFTINQGTDAETEISGPWFRYQFTVTNSAALNLKILTVEFEVTSYKGAQKSVNTYYLDPTIECDGGNNRFEIGDVAPGDTFYGLVGCTTTARTAANIEAWYIHGLDEADTAVYQVKVRPIGYFYDSANPDVATERYESFDFVVTQ